MEDSVNVLKFAECRAREIVSLMEDVTSKEPKLNLQRLPYHMRRRAASHNPKRLPRNLRIKKTDEAVSKNKKKHKVHKDLLVEYNKRQNSDSLWLPTHIWFAKRFHMTKMWGYQLPLYATGKRFRSSYRATMKNVLIQDLSYFCCIELKGEEEKLLSKLSCLTHDSLGMNFASESYIDGTKEGSCFLYHPNSFPFNGIGPVSFLWKPLLKHLNENVHPSCSYRQLWIWCHPSIHAELVEVLTNLFHLEIKERPKTLEEYSFASKVNYMKTKLHFQMEPVYANEDVTMTILKDTLVRHRLIGPHALTVLLSVLNPVESNNELCINKLKSSESSEKELSSLSVRKQDLWNCLRNSEAGYSIPLKMVIGLTVEDPRLYVREVNSHESKEEMSSEEFSKPTTALSAIWDREIRNEITASQIPEHILNKEREKYVNPKASDLKKCTTSVPVLVVHQPSAKGFGYGWDIIAPQGWGMAFWIPFISHGAQPAGFDDFCTLNLESSIPTFPCSFPDTKAGYDYEENVRKNNVKKFYRYSKAKRPNFEILGVPSPYFKPWDVMVREWEEEFRKKYLTAGSDSCSDGKCLFIIRNIEEITNLQKMYKMSLLSHKCQESTLQLKKVINSTIKSLLVTQKVNLKALILVEVKFLSRGNSSNCAGIYMPNECDLIAFKNNSKYCGPMEAKHKLENHSMPDKKRRKLCKEAKESGKMLDRPKIENVMSLSDRKIVGYISEGAYCRLRGQSYGIGHLALTGFLSLLELCANAQSSPIVLIREQHSFQYRPATISILNSSFGNKLFI